MLAREHNLNIFHVLAVDLGDKFLYQSVLLALGGMRPDVLEVQQFVDVDAFSPQG